MATVIKQEFTYSEFIEYVERTPKVKSEVTGDIGNDSSNRDPDMVEWYQTGSYDQAVDFARNGWQAGIDMLATEADIAVGGFSEVRHDVAGSVVDVGAYLSGAPECMVQFVDMQERDREELIVYTQLGYNAGIDGSHALAFSKNVLRQLVKLNVRYSLKLIGVFSATQGGEVIGHEFITIKDTYQNFVLNNLAFSYHPSFFRRLWFRFIETKPYRDGGYGTPVSLEELESTCREFHGETNRHAKMLIIPSVAEIGTEWEIKDLKIVEK